MRKYYIRYTRSLLALVFALLWTASFAQQGLTNAEIQAQLRSKGISEIELQDFLQYKELSVEELERLSPEELLTLSDELDDYLDKQGNNVSEPPAAKSVDPGTTSVKRVIVETEPAVDVKEEPTKVNSARKVIRYGDQLFLQPTISLIDQNSNRPVPGKYILNPGDQVSVSIYGLSKVDEIYTIDESGSIAYDNNNRRLLLGGLSLNEARKKVERAFRNVYVFGSGEITVNVVGVSTIAISIYGEVAKPGGFLISAVNSPINALFAAEGITSRGSYRNIRLIKDNGSTVPIDLYAFLTSPESISEMGLSNNDVIHVPSVQKIVTLTGAVNRPLQYEMKENETVADLLRYAGGLTADANPSFLQVTRLEGDGKRVFDVKLTDGRASNFKLENGDLVSVSQVIGEVTNVVTVNGQVNNPGDFELNENMMMSDLLDKVVLNSSTRTDLALINRTQADGSTQLIKVNLERILEDKNSTENIQLQNKDVLLIWSVERFSDNASALILDGAVRFPGQYPYDRNAVNRLSDLIQFAGGLRRDASNVGMVYRRDPLNKKIVEYIRINPMTATTSVEGAANIVLMPFDSVVIIQNKQIVNEYTVEIAGQINSAGIYQYGKGMTLKDLLVLSDGFTLAAQTDQVEINRVVIKNNQSTEVKIATVRADRDLSIEDEASKYELQPFDKVFVRTVPEFELQKVVTIAGEVKYPGRYVLEDKNEKLMDIIERAGGFTSEAFLDGASLRRLQNGVGEVILNMEEAQKSDRSKYNYILKHQDVIEIPKKEDIVTLQSNSLYKRISTLQDDDGAIDNTISIAFFEGKSADYYVREFGGGFGETSDRKAVFVQHANGEISGTKDYLFFLKYPEVRKGSLIVIPEKPSKKNEEEKEPVNWTQVLNDSVAQAMSILTLLLLIERL